MKSDASTPDQYYESLPADRKAPMNMLRKAISENIPPDFIETVDYGMPGWSVPHSIYPSGYHCNPKIPLPFIGLASQKNFIALYHMGMYADPKLLEWFVSNYPKHTKYKLDMGKSCVRFKKMDDIPYELVAELASKMTVEDWITLYEANLKK